jgi:hypothetical protein
MCLETTRHKRTEKGKQGMFELSFLTLDDPIHTRDLETNLSLTRLVPLLNIRFGHCILVRVPES